MTKHTKRSLRINLARTAVLLGVISTLLVGAVSACPPEQVKQADHAYQVAAGFLQARNWDEAIPQLKSALAICPDHANSLRWLGKAYMATKQYDKAIVQFDALVKAQGKAVTANDYMDQGKAHARLKQYKQARISYIKAERLDGENCNILYNLGVMNSATKNYADAVETLEKAYETCPDIQEQVLKQLARASEKAADRAEKKGDVEGAANFRAKLSQYASSAGGQVGYKLITDRMKAKDYQGAISAAQDFLAKNPESDKNDSVYLNLARSQGALGQTTASFASYKSYLGLKPADGKVAGEYIEKLAEAEQKFQYVVANGSGEIKGWAGQEVTRQEQLEERRQRRSQNSGR
jgi:tetratricopeptide (TPR) repeat protein